MYAQAATELISELKKSQKTGHSSITNLDALLLEVESTMASVLNDGEGFHQSEAHKATAYHLGAGGQRIRARLALHAAIAMQLSVKDAVAISTAVELLHNASLVHDDIQDEATVRRGQESVWALYGTNIAICSGDILLSAAYSALSTLESVSKLPMLLKQVHNCVSTLIHGQCAENHPALLVPSFAAYEAVAAAKSGALIRLPFELVFTVAGRAGSIDAAVAAANAFAIGYQILDDISDIDHDVSRVDRPSCANAVLVLRAHTTGGNAEHLARQAGIMQLRAAAKMAESLPAASGLLLKSMALKLIGQS